MKVFVPKHEAVIDLFLKPQVKKANQGEIVPHKKVVTSVYFYNRHCINDQDVYIKVELSRDMILDLADEIRDIDGQIVESEFDNLPF